MMKLQIVSANLAPLFLFNRLEMTCYTVEIYSWNLQEYGESRYLANCNNQHCTLEVNRNAAILPSNSLLTRPTKKKPRLVIILHYRLYNITIILGVCCPEKNNNIS